MELVLVQQAPQQRSLLESSTTLSDTTQQQKLPATQKRLEQAVERVNRAEAFGSGKEVRFAVDDVTKRFVMQVVDRETREVIQQLPPRQVMRVAAMLEELRRATQSNVTDVLTGRAL